MRRSIARARRFTAADWRLLAAASIAQIAAACALRTMTLPALRIACARLRPVAAWLMRGSADRVIWAIDATGRRLGGVSTCLVRALVAETCLSTPERPLRVLIGVRRGAIGELRAHAWVDEQGRTLIGESSEEFVTMLAWDRVPA